MTPAQIFLAVCMLITGSINTISTKLADMQCVPDYRLDDQPPDTCIINATQTNTTDYQACPSGCTQFDHPFTQSAGMFIGELMCIFAFKAFLMLQTEDDGIDDDGDLSEEFKDENFPPYLFAAPALCDMIATSLMYLGLTMTYASVFQMLRGSVVVFTGLLSILALGKRLYGCHWLGMLLVTSGAFVVGLSSVIGGPSIQTGPAPSNPMLGNILIVCAQVIVAIQMVVEEKILGKYKINALQAVGWEGFFGLTFISILLVVMYFVPGKEDVCAHHGCIENVLEAFRQIGTNWVLFAAVAGNVVSIAFFNYFGISVTKSMSATHRMVLDSLRTMVIWAFSLIVGWQSFQYLQILGFTVLLLGTLIYNELIMLPGLQSSPPMGRVDLLESLVEDTERDGLLG